MANDQKKDENNYYWYAPSVAIGVFIAFLMFNDIISALLFGVPIGILIGYTFAGSVKKER